jgi:heptosyltransferase II
MIGPVILLIDSFFGIGHFRFFRECIEIITTEGRLPVAVTGTLQNRTAANLLIGLEQKSVKNLVGATSIQEMIGLPAGARFLLTNDSGSLHLARLVGTPSLAIFGPTTPESIFSEKLQGRIVPIRLSLPCSPCEFSPHRYRCPGVFQQCMNGLEAVHVENMLLKACQTSRRETDD